MWFDDRRRLRGGSTRLYRRCLAGFEQVVRIEQVTPPRQGLDDLAGAVGQQLAQGVDLLVQAALADYAVFPRVAQQLFARNHLAGRLQQPLQNPATGKAEIDLFHVLATDQHELVERAVEARHAAVPPALQERTCGAIGGLGGQR